MTTRRAQESVAEIATRKQDREYQAQISVAAAEWRSIMSFKEAYDNYDSNHDYESESAYDVGRRSV